MRWIMTVGFLLALVVCGPYLVLLLAVALGFAKSV